MTWLCINQHCNPIEFTHGNKVNSCMVALLCKVSGKHMAIVSEIQSSFNESGNTEKSSSVLLERFVRKP